MIGLVANVYNEVNALPGWLETHTPFFDDVRVLHAGPQGEYSNDGTIELLNKWHIPVEYCAIDEGFGAVRTRALHMSPCEWVMILDADERFYPIHRILNCNGEPTPHDEADAILRGYDFRDGKKPDWNDIDRLGANLTITKGVVYQQGDLLRTLIDSAGGECDSVTVSRRHWHDFSFKRPTQSWIREPDWQMRIVRNRPDIRYDTNTRMHERLGGIRQTTGGGIQHGPFFDHFHFFFKRMEEDQRAHDVEIYDKIHAGEIPPKCPQK